MLLQLLCLEKRESITESWPFLFLASSKKNIKQHQPTNWESDLRLLQRTDALAERKEDPVDVSFLQLEAAGRGAVAELLGQQREGQEDSVGRRQASTSGHARLGRGALEKV